MAEKGCRIKITHILLFLYFGNTCQIRLNEDARHSYYTLIIGLLECRSAPAEMSTLLPINILYTFFLVL